MFLTLLLLVLGPHQSQSQSMPSVDTIRVTPSVTHQFELGKNGVKGSRMERLAWSPDRNELYLMTYEPNKDASIKEAFHYVMQVATGAMKSVEAAPPWVESYWTWKSDRSAPGEPTLSIAVSQDRKRAETGVATPMGGDLARGGTSDTTGLASGAAVNASRGMQFHEVYTLTLKGETIGEWIDHRIQPGLTFSWGPKSSGLIAFAEKGGGKLVIMDRTGKKQQIEGTKGVVLPAWTEDGARMAYLETRGKNKYAMIIAEVK
jgi:hypothetical protein